MHVEKSRWTEDHPVERGVGPRQYGTQEPFASREVETPEGDCRASVWNDQTKHEPRLFPDAGVEQGQNGNELDRGRLQYEASDEYPRC